MTDVRPLLDQLSANLGRTERERLARLERKVIVLEPARRRYREQSELQARLGVVLDGLLRELPLDILYHSPRQRSLGRPARPLRVHPLCLALHRQGVYVVVDVVDGDWPWLPDRILLAIDRMTEVKLGPGDLAFRHPADFDPQVWFAPAFGVMRNGGPTTVLLHVDADWAQYVAERTWHASERLVPQPDGSLRLELEVSDWTEVVDYVLAMGEHVVVLAPEEMRQEVGRRLKAAARRYDQGVT